MPDPTSDEATTGDVEHSDDSSETSTVTTNKYTKIASDILSGLGGKENIELLTNCATRLRVKVKDAALVKDNAFFTQNGAVNVVRNQESLQIIVGLTVPQVREDMSQLIKA